MSFSCRLKVRFLQPEHPLNPQILCLVAQHVYQTLHTPKQLSNRTREWLKEYSIDCLRGTGGQFGGFRVLQPQIRSRRTDPLNNEALFNGRARQNAEKEHRIAGSVPSK